MVKVISILLLCWVTWLASGQNVSRSPAFIGAAAIRPPAGGGGSPDFTYSQAEGTEVDASGTTISAVVEGVAAGSLIVAYCGFEGATTTQTCSDGDSYSSGTLHNNGGGFFGQFHYKLASSSGDRTVTVTLGAAREYRKLVVMVFTYVGTMTYDTEPSGGGAGGSSTAISSGNMTTFNGKTLVLGGYVPFSLNTTSSPLVNSLAADNAWDSQDDSTSPFGTASLVVWAREFSSTFTGAASLTLGASDAWLCGGISFKTQ